VDAAEPAEIVVWRPGRRPDAPRRSKEPARQAGQGRGEDRKTGRGDGKGRKGRRPQRKGDKRPPKPGSPARERQAPKEPDPLSPFAALKELRDAMNERERRSDA
jgi:ATP-dependent RNA helicase SUPV3L1/SUV3